MIAAGIALIAIPIIALIAGTVNAMGWKEAAEAWAAGVAFTAVLVTGAWLLESGLTQ